MAECKVVTGQNFICIMDKMYQGTLVFAGQGLRCHGSNGQIGKKKMLKTIRKLHSPWVWTWTGSSCTCMECGPSVSCNLCSIYTHVRGWDKSDGCALTCCIIPADRWSKVCHRAFWNSWTQFSHLQLRLHPFSWTCSYKFNKKKNVKAKAIHCISSLLSGSSQQSLTHLWSSLRAQKNSNPLSSQICLCQQSSRVLFLFFLAIKT